MIDLGSNLMVYCVGIKGTGTAALAEYCLHAGSRVEGSDVEETFYTDEILENLGIPVHSPFNATNLPGHIDHIFYSAAYNAETNPELAEARRRGIPCSSYPEALGLISLEQPTAAIAGVHGKTTTTAIAGTVAKAVGLPTGVIAGSAVSNFDNRSCLFLGNRALIAETCEYRRHFLNVRPQWLVVTGIEPDHLDYYHDYEDIFSAFLEFANKLPNKGTLIYCADDPGASRLAEEVAENRADIQLIPYGFSAPGPWKISDYRVEQERLLMNLQGLSGQITLRIPGRHTALNAAASAALITAMANDLGVQIHQETLAASFDRFHGSKRRSEIIGEAKGILFMDDYAHHPTAIQTTLQGLKDFYPHRRIIVDFMSHTYSRTEALLDDFAGSFAHADVVVLHDIYASAREKRGSITGETLFNKTQEQHSEVYYYNDFDQAEKALEHLLIPGDLFITMGAGNNSVIGKNLYNSMKGRSE